MKSFWIELLNSCCRSAWKQIKSSKDNLRLWNSFQISIILKCYRLFEGNWRRLCNWKDYWEADESARLAATQVLQSALFHLLRRLWREANLTNSSQVQKYCEYFMDLCPETSALTVESKQWHSVVILIYKFSKSFSAMHFPILCHCAFTLCDWWLLRSIDSRAFASIINYCQKLKDFDSAFIRFCCDRAASRWQFSATFMAAYSQELVIRCLNNNTLGSSLGE